MKSGRAAPAALIVSAGRPGMAAQSASRSTADASPSVAASRVPSLAHSIQHLKAPACLGPLGGRAITTPTKSAAARPCAAAESESWAMRSTSCGVLAGASRRSCRLLARRSSRLCGVRLEGSHSFFRRRAWRCWLSGSWSCTKASRLL